ncbi:MAG: hypothetical protein AB7E36_14075 [Salinivirgaceae bacterium]
MKKLVLLMAGLMILATSSVSAKRLPTAAAKLPEAFKHKIEKSIDYPKEAVENGLEGDVWLKVCVNEESRVKIIDLSATSPELGEHVKKELGSLYVNNPGCMAGETFYVKIRFTVTNL